MHKKSTMLLGLLIFTLPVMADEIYTYTGNDFEVGEGLYTTSDFVSGFFTVATPLGDNLVFGNITPLTYSFSDGVQTFTNSAPPTDVTFEVATDASGAITAWDVSLSTGLNIVSTDSISSDFGEAGASIGENIGDPGGWVASLSGSGSGSGTSTVPEPQDLGFVGIGLAAIGLVRQRFLGSKA